MSTAEIATLNGTAAPAAPKTATFASFINGATTGPLLILWAYLAYWAAVVIYFFDKIDPQLWVNSLIVAVFIGVALNAAVLHALDSSYSRRERGEWWNETRQVLVRTCDTRVPRFMMVDDNGKVGSSNNTTTTTTAVGDHERDVENLGGRLFRETVE